MCCMSVSFCRRLIQLLWNVVLLCVLGGCASPSPLLLAMKPMPQMQDPNAGQELQNLLMARASQTSVINYKDYNVGPEDLLTVIIYGHDNLNREVRVNGQGEITLPLVGVVKVAGLTPQEIEKRLQELYDADYLVNPQITVSVKEFRHQRVAVTGAVAKPGSYEIIGPRTLLEVLSLAGGFINQGYPTGGGAQAGDVVNIIRHQNAPDITKNFKAGAMQPFAPKTETLVINLRRLLSGQEPQLNVLIKNGDVIHVPFAGTAYVLGGVRKPGNIAVKENISVSQAVAMAGGVDPILGTNRITIMRFDAQGKPVSLETNLNNIIARSEPDLPLQDGDVVVVNESTLKKTLYIIRTLVPIPSGGYSLNAF
jgi:polysaccharide export outer membrane protein